MVVIAGEDIGVEDGESSASDLDLSVHLDAVLMVDSEVVDIDNGVLSIEVASTASSESSWWVA